MLLTRNLRLNGTTIDPGEAVRTARDSARDLRDFQAPDREDIKRAFEEVPDRLEEAIEAASESLRDAGDAIRASVHEMTAPPSRTRMPSTRGWVAGIAFTTAAVVLATWLFRRFSSSTTRLEDDDDFASLDREDLDRAASEGMGTAPGASERRSSMTGEGFLSPLDASRETGGSRLTGVMADPSSTDVGGPDAVPAGGISLPSDRNA
jgi:hypothetical protein